MLPPVLSCCSLIKPENRKKRNRNSTAYIDVQHANTHPTTADVLRFRVAKSCSECIKHQSKSDSTVDKTSHRKKQAPACSVGNLHTAAPTWFILTHVSNDGWIWTQQSVNHIWTRFMIFLQTQAWPYMHDQWRQSREIIGNFWGFITMSHSSFPRCLALSWQHHPLIQSPWAKKLFFFL